MSALDRVTSISRPSLHEELTDRIRNMIVEGVLAAGEKVPGGVLIRSETGKLLGAVGITGDTSDNDELCAVAGIKAVGLVADTGAS